MCDYCDCRDLAPIRELGEEHEAIGAMVERLRRALAGADRALAGQVLRQLQAALAPHLEREERGIFAQLATRPGFAWYLGELQSDHALARERLLAPDPDTAGWEAGVPAALDALVEHIGLEEYDLFPASRMAIDDQGWAEIAAVHDQLRRVPDPAQPVAPGTTGRSARCFGTFDPAPDGAVTPML